MNGYVGRATAQPLVVTGYFRPSPPMPAIYLYRDPVDFRKSFRGLAAIVEQELGHNPFDGGQYAFTNRRRTSVLQGSLVRRFDPDSLIRAVQAAWAHSGFGIHSDRIVPINAFDLQLWKA